MFYFRVDVWEGAPGFADNDCYVSEGYYGTFKEAYRALVFFDAEEYFPCLRSVKRRSIWRGNDHVSVDDNYAINSDSLALLGVTTQEYDEIRAEINGI